MPDLLSLKHYECLDAESVLASEWLTLFDALPQACFYHHPDWFLAMDEYLLSKPLEFCAAALRGKPAAILPGTFSAQRHRFSAPVHDHLSLGDILLDASLPSETLEQLFSTLFRDSDTPLWDWQINNLPAHSPLAIACTEYPSIHTQIRKSRESAWFDLTDKLPPGGKLRRNLNRLRAKLSEQGNVRLQWVSDELELAEAFDHFLALECAGWKGQTECSTAIADNAELIGFYRRLLKPIYPGLQPVINLLWLDDACIAAQFGLQTGSQLSLLKIAYAEDQAAFSPGSLLLQDVISEAANRSLQSLSLVTSPAWATRWHPATEPVWHVTRYANNPGGLALKALDRLKQTARARLRPAA